MSLSASVGTGVFSLNYAAKGVEVVVKGTSYRADFKGNLKLQWDPVKLSQFTSGTLGSIPLRIQGHEGRGEGTSMGPITLRKNPDREPPQSILKANSKGLAFPATQDLVIDFHVTIPNLLPGVTLRSKYTPNPGPPILRNPNVTNFPPQNDVYQLVEPIDLEDINNPGPVLATINNFPATVNTPPA